MPYYQNRPCSELFEDIFRLKGSLIGDDLAKWRLLREQYELVEEVMDKAFSPFLEDNKSKGPSLNNEALDLVQILLNLRQTTKEGWGSIYETFVHSVVAGIRFSTSDSPLTILKKAQVLNTCFDSYDNCLRANSTLQVELSTTLARNVEKQNMNQKMDKQKPILTEILSCILKLPVLEPNPNVIAATTTLLLELFQKYRSQIKFKYIISHSNHGKSSPSYDPFSACESHKQRSRSLLTSPSATEIRDPYDMSLCYLSVNVYLKMLTVCDGTARKNAILWNDANFNTFMASFLKSDCLGLRCCSIQFMVFPYLYESEMKAMERSWLVWLPHLCETLNYDDLPWWFDPLDTLTSLIDHFNENSQFSNPVSEFLSETNLMNSVIRLLARCLSLDNRDPEPLKITTKLVKLCASLTAFSELTRKRLFTNRVLLHHAESGLECHLQLIDSFISHKERYSIPLSGKDIPPLFDSECTFAWVMLLKSFSRSVTALRTFLKRNRLAELLLDLVKKIFYLTEDKALRGSQLVNAEIKVMSAALGILSNFVVEFSNLQAFIVENGIITIVDKILKSPLFNDQAAVLTEPVSKEVMPTYTAEVQTNSLWVLRHLMYNSHNDEKLELLSVISMETILQFVNNSNWLVQEQCFQLLRNLTCNSRKVVNILLENFEDVKQSGSSARRLGHANSTYLFEFLAHKLKMLDPADSNQAKAFEGVLYIIVNITAINENKRQLVIQQDELLWFIKEVLENDASLESGYTKGDIQVACLWILTNLIWASTTQNFLFRATEPHPIMDSADAAEGGSLHNREEYADKAPIEGAGPLDEGDFDDDEMSDTYRDDEEDSQEVDDEVNDEEEEEEEGYEEDQSRPPANDHEHTNHENYHTSVNEAHNVGISGEFVRPKSLDAPAKLKLFAAQRCSKLVNMGMYDLVKSKALENNVAVREQAKLLLFHMDLLRKGI
ncbi:LADA_0H07756g1_1 [Lachancea dasiensis]|uniref:LADA_0H07756g1_1 n=1 Tax=Lachancea dasiensis TaxID=1072105 RepID=A0A1G4K269_9SACH|nr:LADA_0H07756g1_1 [Lachancea dasiensis]